MTAVISRGRVFDQCTRCQKIIQLNKAMLGSLHICVNDCELAGKHLAVREEVRGHLWWKKTWAVCDTCRRENPVRDERG